MRSCPGCSSSRVTMYSAQSDDGDQPNETDLYKIEFKYYKAKQKPPDLCQVLDTRKESSLDAWSEIHIGPNDTGIKPTVKAGTVPSVPGLIIVPEAFTPKGLHHWTHRCLLDFPERPNVTNLETLPASVTAKIGQGKVIFDEELRKKLRWATLGYHHDWNSKVYDLTNFTPFPQDLASCAAVFAEKVTGYTYKYKAEAAIVNYYPVGTTLSGHVDHSEENQTAPLISISLGCTCIFLIGGPRRSVRPTPIFLRHGDVAIMTEASRLAYHGVPRVFVESCASYGSSEKAIDIDDGAECEGGLCHSYLKKHRININIRQVHKPDIWRL